MVDTMTTPHSREARFDKILVASDGSSYSADAVKVAIGICQKTGARLYPFTMVLSNPEYETIAPELVEKASMDARKHLDSIVARAAKQGVAAEPLRSGDSPDAEIVAAAAEIDADIIVMGQLGRRGLARMMVGDATVKVIGATRCSVVAVPQAGVMWQKRVLLGTDGSRFADAAAAMADKIARAFALPVTVVSALVPSHSEGRQQEGREAVERTTLALKKDGLDADGIALPGEADDVIIKLAKDKGADLIVLGSHGRTGFGKVLLGSVSERVIAKAKCPILVAKTE